MSELVFEIEAGPDNWIVRGPRPRSRPRSVPSPLADGRLSCWIQELRQWASLPLPGGHEGRGARMYLQGLARKVSERLTAVLLTDAGRRSLLRTLAERTRSHLTIRISAPGSQGDRALSLPWELVTPKADSYPVRDGRLVVLREAVAPGAPGLSAPVGPLRLAVMIAVPEDRTAVAAEQEQLRLLTALASLGQRAAFADLGGLDDLVDLVDRLGATAIHFRGHGRPGVLLFEDRFGFAVEVPVRELRRRLATVLLNPRRAGSFPRLFFLSSPCDEIAGSGEESVAAALHRGGFASVIGWYGPVESAPGTRVEEAFYRLLARGKTVLAAAAGARALLAEERRFPLAWSRLVIYHRGPDHPLAVRGRGPRPPRFRRAMVEISGLPVLERGFIGRRSAQYEILRRVERDGHRLLVLQGLGGLGKTALASRLLTLFASRPEDQLILRCNELEGSIDPLLELRAQAEQHGRSHGLPLWHERMEELRVKWPEPVEGFTAVVRALREVRPHLALYADNAETLQTGPRTDDPQALGNWRPGIEVWWRALERLADEGEGVILLSTRYLWPGLRRDVYLGVEPMNAADCLQMIDSFPSLARLPREVRAEVAERVDGHPRTIELLAGLVARQREVVTERSAPRTGAWRRLIEPILPEQDGRITADLLVREIWHRLSRQARAHGRRLSVLFNAAPPFVVDQLGGARDELIRASLLTRYRRRAETAEGSVWLDRWGFHSLVKEFIAGTMRKGQRLRAHRAAGDAFELWSEKPDSSLGEQIEGVLHLHFIGEGNRSWPMVKDCALWLRSLGQFAEARWLLEGCIDAGAGGETQALVLVLLSEIRQAQGEAGAEINVLISRALELATTDETRGLAIAEEGRLLQVQGDYAAAEGKLLEAVALLKRAGGLEEHPDLEASLFRLADFLTLRGRLDEAEALLARVVSSYREPRRSRDSGYAAALHGMAYISYARGKYKDAEGLLREALSIKERTLGEEHPELGATMHLLAIVLGEQGRWLEAEGWFRRLIELDRTALSEDDPARAAAFQALADLLIEEGRPGEAEPLLRDALDFVERTREPDHPENAGLLHSLAFVLHCQDKHEEAVVLAQRAVSLIAESLGEEHPDFGAALMTLGMSLHAQGQTEEAVAHVRRVVSLVETSLGDQHPAFATALANLAKIVQDMNDLDEAESLLRRSLAIIEIALGRDHPSRVELLKSLALLLDQMGRETESIAVVREIIACQER